MSEMDASVEDDRIVLAFTTVPDPETGARIGRLLVEERLAGCVSRIPGVVSTYRFEGTIHEDPESLLLIKTTRRRVADLERRLLELHPYKVPEFLAVDSSAVAGLYANWLRSVTK